MAKYNPYRTNTGIHIEWFTVRRSTVYSAVAALVLTAGAAGYSYYIVKNPPKIDDRPIIVVDDTSARFLGLDGTVKVRKAGTYEWIDANTGIALTKDDTIRTVGNSSARVRLFDGTEYLVKPDSILVIEEASEDPETKATNARVTLTAGQVNLTTPSGGVSGSRREIGTPTTEASFAENTNADVSFDNSSRRAGFTVFQGRSDVRSGEQQLTLESAEAVDVSADGIFSDVIKLPDVPSLISPANLSVIPVTATTEFKWRQVDGARRYHFVLDRSPTFRDPIFESTVPGRSVIHRDLGAGTYYWQVTAIDRDDRRGAPSEFAKFTVSSRADAAGAEPPDLSVLKPTVTLDGLVTIRGRSIPGAVVTVDRGMGDDRVQVKDDGSFIYYFTIAEAGRHPVVVKARRRDGGGVAEKTVYAEIGTD